MNQAIKGTSQQRRSWNQENITHANTGVQRGKAWSAVINEVTGKTTIIGADDEAGFVVFAACTPR